MAPSLDPFPDLCLIAIFVHLPLWDLLSVVGLVCARWRVLLPTVLARRRSLKIIQADLVVERFEPDYLYSGELIYHVLRDDGSPWAVRTKVDNRTVVVVPNSTSPQILTEPFTDALMDLLPNITSLTVVCSRNVPENLLPELSAQITRMLNHWQGSLVTLNLSIEFNFDLGTEENTDPLIMSLLESIDRLRSLRHLKLGCNFRLVNFEHEMQIISQLNTFTFSIRSGFYYPNWIIRSLLQYANPEVITQITLNSVVDFDRLIEFTPQLASKFTMANCRLTPIAQYNIGSLDTFKTFCNRFTSVRYLHIEVSGDILHTISSYLAQLQHLVHLVLALVPHFDADPRELTPIPSVRALFIDMANDPENSHHNIENCLFPQVFPNVQVIEMMYCSLVCRDCGYDARLNNNTEHRPEEWAKIHECKQMARQALTRFPNVHTFRLAEYPSTSDGTLSLDDWDLFDSLEQL